MPITVIPSRGTEETKPKGKKLPPGGIKIDVLPPAKPPTGALRSLMIRQTVDEALALGKVCQNPVEWFIDHAWRIAANKGLVASDKNQVRDLLIMRYNNKKAAFCKRTGFKPHDPGEEIVIEDPIPIHLPGVDPDGGPDIIDDPVIPPEWTWKNGKKKPTDPEYPEDRIDVTPTDPIYLPPGGGPVYVPDEKPEFQIAGLGAGPLALIAGGILLTYLMTSRRA